MTITQNHIIKAGGKQGEFQRQYQIDSYHDIYLWQNE